MNTKTIPPLPAILGQDQRGSCIRILPSHGYARHDQAAAEIKRAFYSSSSYRSFTALPADALLFQVDYGGPLRGPWLPRMPLQMRNESDDDSVPALISDSESSEDEDYYTAIVGGG